MEYIQNVLRNIRDFGLERYGRYYGTYKGFVHSNEDPEMRARLQLEIPQINGKHVSKYWALPKGMYSAAQEGFVAIPNAGDPVWVVFEAGDRRRPIWEYGWFAEGDLPKTSEESYPEVQTWQYRSNRIVINGAENYIRITGADGKVFEVNKDGLSLGSETESAEPAALGQTTTDRLTEITQQLNALSEQVTTLSNAIVTFAGAQAAVTGAVAYLAPLTGGYTALQGTSQQVASNIPANIVPALKKLIDVDIPKIKSKIVTVD